MIYLEMSRDETHGGGTWAFPFCIWAPTKRINGTRWAYWEKILSVREGDTILHLRGVPPNALFTGYSRASSDGYIASSRPPDPGQWSYAQAFYKADLNDYVAFHTPVNLQTIFTEFQHDLELYFERNKQNKDRHNLFFVRQAGRLQCQNGGYLSDVDNELYTVLFGTNNTSITPSVKPQKDLYSVETGHQLRNIYTRLGQTTFSKRIKELYSNQCCFPSCSINDPAFLIGSHIARWSDNEKLRGELGNGLCLCILHDRAFELGFFTIDDKYCVYVNSNKTNPSILELLLPYQGQQINLAKITPLTDALLEHWLRSNIDPLS